MTTMDDFILADELLLLQEDAIESYYISNETQIRGKNEHDLYSYLNGKVHRMMNTFDI
jgi:hypothetical protein